MESKTNWGLYMFLSLIGMGAFFCAMFLIALFFWCLGINDDYSYTFGETVIFFVVSVCYLIMATGVFMKFKDLLNIEE